MAAVRDPVSGKFVKGNPGSPGRPKKETERVYLDVLKSELTPALFAQIVRRAVNDAKNGGSEARRWLSDYALGRPPQIVELRNVDMLLIAQTIETLTEAGYDAASVFEDLIVAAAEKAQHNEQS